MDYYEQMDSYLEQAYEDRYYYEDEGDVWTPFEDDDEE